ncbi:MAG: hypothetical protein ABDH18_03495 [Aquificaceae bacterium]
MKIIKLGDKALIFGSQEPTEEFKNSVCIYQKDSQYHLRIFGLEYISKKLGSELNVGFSNLGLVIMSLLSSLNEPDTKLVLKELYLSKPFCVDFSQNALDCAKRASSRGLSHAIVVNSGKALGVLRIQDSLRAKSLGLNPLAGEICIKKLLDAKEPVWQGVQKLLWFDCPALPVVEEGNLIGEFNLRVFSIWLGELFGSFYSLDILRVLSEVFNQEGCFLVGGAVRDIFLKPGDLKEVDILFLGDAGALARKISESSQVFEEFGTAKLSFKDLHIELSSARQESYESPGAYPRVEQGGLPEDLWRRDFSINAMALEIKSGHFIDPCGGLSDLGLKQLRVLHPLSFVEDPVRILRAIRFFIRDGLNIEPWTMELMQGSLGFLKLAPKARIYKEINQILSLIDSPKFIEWLRSIEVFQNIFEGFSWAKPEDLNRLWRLLCEFGICDKFGYSAFIISLSEGEVLNKMQAPRWVKQGFEFLRSKKPDIVKKLKSSMSSVEVYNALKSLKDFELALIYECERLILVFKELKGKEHKEESLFLREIAENCFND